MTNTTEPVTKVLICTGRTGSGMTSGASLQAGATRDGVHAWNADTSKTACGRNKGKGYAVGRRGTPAEVVMCRQCRKTLGL